MTPERRKEIERHLKGDGEGAETLEPVCSNAVADALAEIDRLTAALQFIEAWQLPWVRSEQDHRSNTYSYEYGSNGERDYMRNVAASALRDETPHYLPPGVELPTFETKKGDE